MRLYRVRLDLFITLILAILLAFGARAITPSILAALGYSWEVAPVVVTGSVAGAIAEESLPRMESIAEVKAADGLFTIEVSKARHNVIVGAGGFWWLEFPNGEVVLAKVLLDSVRKYEVDYKERYILPAGILVNEPASEEVISLVPSNHPITDTSFYIDMAGGNQSAQVDGFSPEEVGNIVFVFVLPLAFVLIRILAVRLGLFPPMFKKKTAIWTRKG